MSKWRSPMSFGIFYTAVYEKNAVLYQYKIVNILLEGGREYGQALASKYCRNNIAVSGDKVYEIVRMTQAELEQKVELTGINDPGLAARTLLALLRSDHILMDENQRQSLIAFATSASPICFIARMLPVAVSCNKEKLVRITDELKDDILALRDSSDEVFLARNDVSLNDSENESLKSTQSISEPEVLANEKAKNVPSYASYDVRELSYPDDTETDFIELLNECEGEKPIPLKDKRRCADSYKRSALTCVISYTASVRGLADILIHRFQEKQCSQIILTAAMRSESEYADLKKYLSSCVDHVLSNDGLFIFVCIYEPSMPEGQYSGRVITSLLSAYPEKQRMNLVMNEGVLPDRAISPNGNRTPDSLFGK